MSENKEQSKFKRFAVTAFWYLFASIFVAIVFYLLFALLFSTQEEKRLGKENRLYSSLYDDMSARLELIGDVVEGLTGRDAAIYEELFDTQPPMADVVTNLREPASYAEDLSEVQYVKIATRLSVLHGQHHC